MSCVMSTIDDYIRPCVKDFVALDEYSNIFILYGGQALKEYLPDIFNDNSWDIDFLIKKQPGQYYSTTYYAYKVIEYFREHIPVEMSYHVLKSSSKFNQKNTVKIFIDNKPLIDISEENETDKYYDSLYPPIQNIDGYSIKSFEWLILNLIDILKTRHQENTHIWDKMVRRAKRIIFIINHKSKPSLLSHQIDSNFNETIEYLSKLVHFNDSVCYYSEEMYESERSTKIKIESKFQKLTAKMDLKMNEYAEIMKDLKKQIETEKHLKKQHGIKNNLFSKKNKHLEIEVATLKSKVASFNKESKQIRKLVESLIKPQEEYFTNEISKLNDLILKYETDISRLQTLVTTCKSKLKLVNTEAEKQFKSTNKKELNMNSKLQTTCLQLKQSQSKEDQATMWYKKVLIENIKLKQTSSEVKESILKYSQECKDQIHEVKEFNKFSHQQICSYIDDLQKKIELLTEVE